MGMGKGMGIGTGVGELRLDGDLGYEFKGKGLWRLG